MRRSRFVSSAILGLWLSIAGLSSVNGQNDLAEIPQPNPVAEAAAMKVHPGAKVNLFAADPWIRKPIQINFDSTGGLWVASSEVYPQIQPGEKANDKIVVLRDSDGDGTTDTHAVFAEGLLIPTGVLPDGPHAAYVAESTRLLYMEDTDHDGKADTKKVILSGFGTEDTHHLIHTLRFGPDGCVYFNQSIYIHSHVDTPYGSRHLDGGGIWRYRPSTGRLEVFCKGFINPWGHVFDSHGESFVTDGAFFEGINYTFPDAVFVTSPGATRWLKGLNPGSPKHCGLEILSGTHVPPDWVGTFVTSDFRSHRVCRFDVRPAASGYLSRQQPEIITTPHVAFRPIDARMGPDGALYVADWYNPIIQHGEVDFRDDRRDRKHGRIWRVSFPDRELDRWPDFQSASVSSLLELLEDDAIAVRQFARQTLWQRARADQNGVTEAVQAWVAKDRSARMIQWLWFYEATDMKSFDDLKLSLDTFDSISPEDRRSALRSLWRNRLEWEPDSQPRKTIETFALALTEDADPRVRLEAVMCAGQTSGREAIHAVLRAIDQAIDDNLDFALWQSIRNLSGDGSVLATLQWNGHDENPGVMELSWAVDAIGTPEAAETAVALIESDPQSQDIASLIQAASGAADPSQLGRLLKRFLRPDWPNRTEAFKALLDRTEQDGTIPEAAGTLLAASIGDADDLVADKQSAAMVAKLAAAWKAESLESTLVAALPRAEPELKSLLIAAVGSLDSKSAIQTIRSLSKSDDEASRLAAIASLAKKSPSESMDSIVSLLTQESTFETGADLVNSMLGRKWVADKLAEKIAQMSLPIDRARLLLRMVQSKGGHKGIEAAIRKSGNLDDATWKLTAELSKRVSERVPESGSAQRGEAIYRRQALQCIQCHAIGNAGGLVGPNLISIGGSAQLDYILESLLDPSAKLKEGYTTRSVLTDEAELFSGIVIGKSDTAIRLRLADGKEIEIPMDAIEQEKAGKSLMPEGLFDSLTEDELVDLVAFLSALGRESEYTVSTEPLVRSFDMLVYSAEANRRLNRTSTDTAASNDPAMKWASLTTMVDGTIPLKELDQFRQHKQTPPTSFVRFSVNLPAAGEAKVGLSTDGVEAWIDGMPTPVWKLKSLQLGAGIHTFVLAIDRTKQSDSISIKVEGDAVP